MKTVQAKLIKERGEDTTNQPIVDLVLSHVENFRVNRGMGIIFAYTCSGNIYIIEGEENLTVIQSELE